MQDVWGEVLRTAAEPSHHLVRHHPPQVLSSSTVSVEHGRTCLACGLPGLGVVCHLVLTLSWCEGWHMRGHAPKGIFATRRTLAGHRLGGVR